MGLFSSSSSSDTRTYNTQSDEKVTQTADAAVNTTGRNSAKVASGKGVVAERDSYVEVLDDEVVFGALSFASDAYERLVSAGQEAQGAAFSALEETKDLASSIIARAQETPDDRLGDFGKLAFGGVVALAALYIWKG